nr:MAG TPA: Major capsid protein [Microviridae sp.]
MIRRDKGRMVFDTTGTINMGLNYPCNIVECFPGDSFIYEMKSLLRFLPQVAPTMSNVIATVDTYTVPIRQLCEKIGINWDDYLTGGEDGTLIIDGPMITVPETGFEPGSIADWLNYPTNYKNLDFDSSKPESADNPKVIIVAAGRKYSAWAVIAYMHIINENYRDPNFIKKLDLKKYQEFIEGKYVFETPSGDPIDYQLCVKGVFPKAWSRDYAGQALPNTQRGPTVKLPVSGNALVQPDNAPLITLPMSCTYNGNTKYYHLRDGDVDPANVNSWSITNSPEAPSGYHYVGQVNRGAVYGSGMTKLGNTGHILVSELRIAVTDNSAVVGAYWGDQANPIDTLTSDCSFKQSQQVADLSGVNVNLAEASGVAVTAQRLALRMQHYGEMLQYAGARAVEYTLKMFGIRIPDDRVQRPIFHGSYRMPVVFSEVLQTSNTTETSPQGNLAGHGITGGANRPMHIKVIEHSFVISILNVMPRSQFREFVPAYMFRKNRLDIPVPMMQGIGDQPMKREQIFPNSKNPDENFGFIPQYSDLWNIPSTLHGHMKDTFLHWNMARAYKTEPVLSAAWRYERPTDRSFSVRDEDQIQLQMGFVLKARRPFKRYQQPTLI